MGKKKADPIKKEKKPAAAVKKLKVFVIQTRNTKYVYHYVEATSLEEAQKMWDDGTYDSKEVDYDECGAYEEELIDITESK
jgi:hypothetical protein